ncbi:MAG TPA: MarR family winged helix-turn-helix transcriptional regulator [Firmicutes bacterium]|nr:MarR family winged helix-turn-helix transcriptional regulator [Bacillota bacterium]
MTKPQELLPEGDPLAIFNQHYKKMDELYHRYAKAKGLSDAGLWLLYSLCLSKGPITQRALADEWHYPPQTFHSALQNLVKNGLITLAPLEGNRKNKAVLLTESGDELMKTVILPLIHAERQAISRLSRQDQQLLLHLMGQYVTLLEEAIAPLSQENRKKESALSKSADKTDDAPSP